MSIKILIWDLDDTFWSGTLSEGKVYPVNENMILIKELVDRGIMNSIVSKNDYDKAMEVLKDWGVNQYFIFPHISWSPKGNEVKLLLNDCNLRADNAMFVDDNPSNLEEVRYYNPGIICVEPDYLRQNNILGSAEFMGKDDRKHSRLKQYRVLEARSEKKSEYASNEDFLRSSHIRISCRSECDKEIDRIEELIQRTNQMNYTKNRMGLDELAALIKDPDTQTSYILAEDDFGDYGIVGFYALKGNKLVHFLFSCRVLGFGIENYIYQKLGCPIIEVSGDVATQLDVERKVDWISENYDIITGQKTGYEQADIDNRQRPKLLMIGGCDLQQAAQYLKGQFEINTEFATVVNGQEIRTSNTVDIVAAKEMPVDIQKEFASRLPFYAEGITYATKIYSSEYKVIIISLVDDYIRGIYRNIENGWKIGYGIYWSQEEGRSQFAEGELNYLKNGFAFEGRETVEEFKENLEKISSYIAPNTKLIFINGIDIDVSDWIGEDRVLRNQEMNSVIDEVVEKYKSKNVFLLDMRKLVTSRAQLIKNDNRHFERQVYFEMAKEISALCTDILQINIRNMLSVEIEKFPGKIKRKFGGVFHQKK